MTPSCTLQPQTFVIQKFRQTAEKQQKPNTFVRKTLVNSKATDEVYSNHTYNHNDTHMCVHEHVVLNVCKMIRHFVP